MTKQPVSLFWFRQDLRIHDNPGLTQSVTNGQVCLPVYIFDDENAGADLMGEASQVWLHYALQDISSSLQQNLSLYRGDALEILLKLSKQFQIQSVYWNRCYEPWRVLRDIQIKKKLMEIGVEVHSYNGSLLWEPWQVKKKDGSRFKVFTPFYRRGCLTLDVPREPLPAPQLQNLVKDSNSLALADMHLLPNHLWGDRIQSYWDISEQGAQHRLEKFLREGILNYREGRNLPAKPFVSKLSPYIHIGQISPNQAWYAAKQQGESEGVDHFCSELGWREFSYSQLYYFPELPRKNIQAKFDHFAWRENPIFLKAWQQGQTGIPMVDAGMRELWLTGYMHNRVRMIVGSFLVKNLLLDWRHGARWFWNCLVDADLASNSASWQWVSGCGADAAPYFRIFNPVTQGKKFDADGEYVREYVPEIASLPNQYLFSPWESPEVVLQASGVQLGVDYPHPIVELKASREKALSAFSALKGKR